MVARIEDDSDVLRRRVGEARADGESFGSVANRVRGRGAGQVAVADLGESGKFFKGSCSSRICKRKQAVVVCYRNNSIWAI